ncbi:BnaC08g44580D [Brassica napus]|uniref:BnaC08g44580D protein n=1 Tax=Brassica napus TaxID=3708 RepID=A0A078FD65_BRANA|nr:BnaC08g44580D [Brassica napus]
MSLWHPNLKLLLVTHGEKGCPALENFHGSVEAFNVNAVVDTNGAGDSSIGAFLSQIVDDQSVLEEKRLRKVLRFSNACGAITMTKKGAIPALPSDSEALCFLGL